MYTRQNGHAIHVVKRGGKYCQEKQSNGKKIYKAEEPQSASKDVFTRRRNYSKHAHSNDYVRRVTWLEENQRNASMSIVGDIQVLIHTGSLQILNVLVHTFGCNHRSKNLSEHRSLINFIGRLMSCIGPACHLRCKIQVPRGWNEHGDIQGRNVCRPSMNGGRDGAYRKV